ncbi:hypothetical protein BN1007_40326 [Klebsiella variicola]|nr:hypothetical protein BN1007_40326 [Klebsiella variicola]CTQ24378.1 hypothetical protein BN1200_490002 [Klebsiella variicola]
MPLYGPRGLILCDAPTVKKDSRWLSFLFGDGMPLLPGNIHSTRFPYLCRMAADALSGLRTTCR